MYYELDVEVEGSDSATASQTGFKKLWSTHQRKPKDFKIGDFTFSFGVLGRLFLGQSLKKSELVH